MKDKTMRVNDAEMELIKYLRGLSAKQQVLLEVTLESMLKEKALLNDKLDNMGLAKLINDDGFNTLITFVEKVYDITK